MAKVPTSPQDKSPFSDKLGAFTEALETLYIKSNLSGRHQFRAAYPEAAAYVFGPALMEYDASGGGDKAQRVQEELQADERRDALIELIIEVREKSVASGVLQLQYIESILHQLGPEMGEAIFSPWVVEKIFPPANLIPSPEKQSPKDIAADFNIAPIEVAPKIVSGRSPFNLAEKKNLVELDSKMRGVSYKDLVAYAQRLLAYSISKKFNLSAR